jgi:peptide/nickel transport system ATP-binding protein
MVLSSLLDPSLLIADEVTSALDVTTQKAVSRLLVEFRDRGFVKSIIVITHDLSILYQIADSIIVMYAGKLVEKGSARDVTEDPRHPYPRALLAAMPSADPSRRSVAVRARGDVPSPLHPPPGCRFHTRCPEAFARCRAEAPALVVRDDGASRCFLAE